MNQENQNKYQIDLDKISEDLKDEFYELAFLSILDCYELKENEAIICEIEYENPENNEHVFLNESLWFDFLEKAKEHFIETQNYEICSEISKLQNKLKLSNIIESLHRK